MYEIVVFIFRAGSAEEFLFWQRDLNKVLIGQNAVTGPSRYAMTRRLLDGDALAAFD
jgi:hypothetical protein